ncbi:MAG: hypothetical protein R3D57_12185 [Hyphomicrobiaceae bacterium]
MQAVRELLFGEAQRAFEARIQRLEAKIATMEQGLADRFRELSQRFDELARTAEVQQSKLSDVGRAFSAVGQQLSSLSAVDAGGMSQNVRKPE